MAQPVLIAGHAYLFGTTVEFATASPAYDLRFVQTDGTRSVFIGTGGAWLGPYTAAEVGLGGGGGGGLAPDGIVQGAGTYSATAINGYRVLVAGSANWSVTFTGGGVASIPFGAMTVGQVYPEALTAITIGTGGSALLYIP